MRRRRVLVGALLVLLGGVAFVRFGNDVALAFEGDATSESSGTTAEGALRNGKRLPNAGPNFRAYGYLPTALGRNTLHGSTRNVVLAAFDSLARSHPELVFVYAECSWPGGGRLYPHATHQNGLSIDLMVPVRKRGRSVPLPTTPWNRYGYDVEFDAEGHCEDLGLDLDFEALAALLWALERAADEEGIGIWRVIFDPELQPKLFASEAGRGLPEAFTFSERRSWVRHDEHIHVDFELP